MAVSAGTESDDDRKLYVTGRCSSTRNPLRSSMYVAAIVALPIIDVLFFLAGKFDQASLSRLY